MSSRNNPISAVQKKRTASTTPKKRTVSSSRPSRAPKKAPVKQHYSMPGWLRNILAVAIVGCFSMVFYYFFIRPYAYRWKPCNGLKEYGVCIPDGYDVHGIDVSHYQENIDWERLRNASLNSSPVSFVFIKATEGTTLLDDNFNLNFYEAKQNDFIRGAYHFFLPDVDAQKQARFFLKQVHLEPGDLPPVLDVEKVGKLTETQLQKAVKTWLDIVEKEYGVKPIIYTGYKFKLHYLNTPAFDEYPYWIAHYYVEKLEYRGKWNFWQHTDCGKVTGIKGNVDCNIFNGSFEDLMKLTIPEQEDNYTDPEDSL